MKQKILIVNSEPSARQFIEQSLRQEGFEIKTAGSYNEALRMTQEAEPDLMIVDPKLPDIDRDAVCQKIRATPNIRTIPMLIVTGDYTDGFSAKCLNSGADGFLRKDVAGEDLLAHVKALLRRSRIYLWENDVIQRGRLTLRQGERRVLIDNKEAPSLTPKEYAVLQELILCSPRVLDKNALVGKVWGVTLDELGRKTLDVHIQRVRRKLGDAADALKTVSLVGYQWLPISEKQ